MATSVRLNDDFVADAKVHAEAENRTVPKQIEYWAKIGKMMIDNPDLTYEFARESLLAESEIKHGIVTPYERKTPRD